MSNHCYPHTVVPCCQGQERRGKALVINTEEADTHMYSVLFFWLYTFKLWIWNRTMTMKLKCRLSPLMWGYFHPYRVNRLDISVDSPPILVEQKYWDEWTYMSIKVVRSLVFGPILLSSLWLQICWMHVLFVFVVFQIILCPIEMNGKSCIICVLWIWDQMLTFSP
jgi:hypothetical protein